MSLVIIGGALMQVASGVVKHQAGMQGRMFRSYGISKNGWNKTGAHMPCQTYES